MKLSIKELKALAKLIQGSETDESDVKADKSWNDGIKSITFVAEEEEEEEESFDVMEFLKANHEEHGSGATKHPYSSAPKWYKYSGIIFLEKELPFASLNIFPYLVYESKEIFVDLYPPFITTKREFESILSIAKKMNNESN